jgi:tetratricopeptide (TPR) repeat protein
MAIALLEESLAIAQTIGDWRSQGNALAYLGNVHFYLDDIENAIGYYENALAVARDIGDRRSEAVLLGDLAIASVAQRDAGKAIAFYQRQLVIFGEIRDLPAEAMGRWAVARLLNQVGQIAQAIRYAELALPVLEMIRHSEVANIKAKLEEWRHTYSANWSSSKP